MAKICSVLVLSGYLSPALAYKAAFAEHEFVSPCGQQSCGAQTLASSAKAYAGYAQTAASKGAQIIVFPEYGITGESSYPKQSWVSGGYTEVVPQPGGIPCNSEEDATNAPTIRSLSCAAKQNKIAIVANLIDLQNGNIYNTDVAFDTDGKLLAKYHKMNLWGESNIDVPSRCEEATFTTSFGIKFGMFTCADLIYQHPAVDYVNEGIKHFTVPVAWTNDMASQEVKAYAQGWSNIHGVNIIVANQRSSSSSGSGIWSAGKTLASYYNPGSGTSVLVADVPETPMPSQSQPFLGNQSVLHQPDEPAAHDPRRLQPAPSPGPSSSAWQFASLSTGKVCNGELCCTAQAVSGGASGYAIAALNGMDSDGGVTSGIAQACAVLPCQSPGSSCLTFQSPSGSLKEVSVSMSGNQAPYLVPEVMASGGYGSDQVLLTPGSTTDGYVLSASTGANADLHASTTKTIHSAIIYGRRFDQDRLPYTCGKTSTSSVVV